MVDWPEIVEKYGPYVWRTAYRLLSHREEANDCYQDTFLQAVEYSRGKKIESWPALLRRIATARALDQLRKRYRDRTVALENGADLSHCDADKIVAWWYPKQQPADKANGAETAHVLYGDLRIEKMPLADLPQPKKD